MFEGIIELHRRQFLQAGAAFSMLTCSQAGFAATGDAKVKTVEGELQGAKSAKGYQFRGVRYAEPQTQANQFKPPIPLMSWSRTRDATKDGKASVQVISQRPAFGGPFVTGLTETTPQGEDCLFVNVFTPALTGKRPVMFWCHGGGFASGGGGLPLYDGTNLAAYGDVVVVAVNHRLNILGFGLPSVNGQYTANAGMLDIAAALQWVNRNIASFGGDPSNVTIFGQSGGGSKVSTLLVMPSAKGLFHRAIVESGSTISLRDTSSAINATAKVAKQLGVSPEQLATMPAEKVVEATRPPGLGGFGPVIDGRTITRSPFDPDAPTDIKDIPMMIGTVKTETSYTTDEAVFTLDEQSMQVRAKDFLGDFAPRIIAEYRAAHPSATPSLLYFLMTSDAAARRSAIIQAERQASQQGAPVFMYHFEWETPVNKIWYTPHAIEISFVFRNIANVVPSIGTGKDQEVLQDQVSSAWVAFARTGNPSNKVTGNWPHYDTQKRLTMIFDKHTRVVSDPDRSDREIISRVLGTAPLKRFL